MDFAETEEQRHIRDTVSEIAADYDWRYWREHIHGNEFPSDYWEDLANGGWLGVTIPEDYGGAGLGMLEMAIVIEELSRGGGHGQGGIIFVLTPVVGGIGIQRHGTDEQKEQFLPAIADGVIRFCMATTEADAGHNLTNIDTSAEKNGDEFVLQGRKMFISGVENADYMLLVARTSEFNSSNPIHGITLFIVEDPATQDAISLTPLDMEVPWFEVQYQVDIDDLRVHEDQILGEVDGGLYLLWDTLNTERIAGAASALGGGLRAVDLAVEYATDREVFGQPIGAHQAIQHPLADAYADLICAREMTYKAAWKWDEGEDASKEANVAKLRASEAATRAADRAIQTHGGNGFSAEYEVFTIWENARFTQSAPVSNEMVRNFIAEHHLGLPRSY